MCVIGIIPPDTNVPYYDFSRQFRANSHGGGLAYYQENGKIAVEKGFFKADEMFDRLYELRHHEVVYHLRLATHGKTNPSQCHPFAIKTSVCKAKAVTQDSLKSEQDSVLFHNGIISFYGDKDHSDTLNFVVKALAHMPNAEYRVNLLEMEGCKYVLMEGGYLYTIGLFSVLNGVNYSNQNWHFKKSCNPYYSNYDDYEGEPWEKNGLQTHLKGKGFSIAPELPKVPEPETKSEDENHWLFGYDSQFDAYFYRYAALAGYDQEELSGFSEDQLDQVESEICTHHGVESIFDLFGGGNAS